MSVHSNSSIVPLNIDECTIKCLTSYNTQNNSCIIYSEGDTLNQETAHITNSKIYIGQRVWGCNRGINFTDTDFYITEDGTAFTANNVAKNCNFYITNCSEASRIFMNRECSIIDSSITFTDTRASQYRIHPKELVNTTIISPVPVLTK